MSIKDTTVIAVAEDQREGEVRVYGTLSSDLHAVEKALRKTGGEDVTLHVVYEAGPTGYVIYRRLQQLKIDCIVVAPSKLPYEKGVRQKTDRRDALMLARLHRAGELTAIHVPDAVDESIRDLTRARADTVHDLTRAKQRPKSFLLRQGYRYSGKANWSEAHQRYLRELVLPLPALKAVLEKYLLAITQTSQRVERLDDLISAQVPQRRMYPAVEALMCLPLLLRRIWLRRKTSSDQVAMSRDRGRRNPSSLAFVNFPSFARQFLFPIKPLCTSAGPPSSHQRIVQVFRRVVHLQAASLGIG